MIYIYKDRIIRLEWTILKGTSNVKEDFSRALLKLFLIGPADKYLLDATAENGIITAMVPEGLPEGNYSVEVIYAKNWGNLRRGDAPCVPPTAIDPKREPKPIDERFNDRCLMRSRKDDLFGITNYESEADNVGEGEVVVALKTSVATYGYDGLSIYELAVMRGYIGSETDFIHSHEPGGDINRVYITLEEVYGLEHDEGASLLADRAIADENGRRIIDEYITYRAAKGYLTQVYNQLFTENPPHIMDGYITADMLSEGVKDLLGSMGNVVNLPDEEDLTKRNGVLKLADKRWNPNQASGMGRKILRRNMVNGVNVLTQDMMSEENTIYIIQYDFDLQSAEITIPENCVLDFQGGSLSCGIIIGNNTSINYNVTYNIFNDCILKGFILPYVDIRWVGAIGDYNEITKEGSDNAPYFQRAFDNILEYHRGISLYISGKYLLKSSVIVSGDFNMKGNHHPTRNFIDSKAYADVDINSVETFPYGSSLSLIAVDRDIIGFNVIGYNNGSYNYNVMNISNIKFIGVDPKSSKAIYYTASGAPSRGGSIFQCEASKFLYFIHFDNKNNTIYAIMNIMECNIYNCGKAIYAYSSSTPNKYGLQHLNIQNNVIEHNGENCLYLTALENVTIINNLFEGEDNPIYISTYYNHRSAVVIKRNYFERRTTGDTKIYVAGPTASNTLYFNTSVAISENTAIYDFKISLNYVRVVELDKVDFTSRFAGCCFEYGIPADKFGVFNISNYCLFSEYPETQNVDKINYIGYFGNDSVLQDNLGTSENKTSTRVIVKDSSKDMTFISILKFDVNSYPNLEPGHEAPIVTYGENYNNGHIENRKFTIYGRHPYYLVHKFTPYLDVPNYNLYFSINPAIKSNVCLYQDVSNVYRLTDLPYYKNTNYIPNGDSSEYYSSNGNTFFDKNLNKVKYCINNLWVDNDGYTATLSKGETSQRPNNLTPSDIGFMFFDTSINKPIYATNISEDGNITWVDATGAEV